jgi:hypothetical protein
MAAVAYRRASRLPKLIANARLTRYRRPSRYRNPAMELWQGSNANDREVSMTTRYALGAAILGLSLLPLAATPASANLAGMTQAAVAADADPFVIQVQRRGNVRVNRSAVRVNRSVNVNRNIRVNRAVGVNRAVNVNRAVRVNRAVVVPGRGLYRGRYVYRGGPWVRPRNYWWPVGGAIAAGAALGVLTAASATAWAGAAPGPGYCWYYTDPSYRQGFWDVCQ